MELERKFRQDSEEALSDFQKRKNFRNTVFISPAFRFCSPQIHIQLLGSIIIYAFSS
jgi:hypothetical protein